MHERRAWPAKEQSTGNNTCETQKECLLGGSLAECLTLSGTSLVPVTRIWDDINMHNSKRVVNENGLRNQNRKGHVRSPGSIAAVTHSNGLSMGRTGLQGAAGENSLGHDAQGRPGEGRARSCRLGTQRQRATRSKAATETYRVRAFRGNWAEPHIYSCLRIRPNDKMLR